MRKITVVLFLLACPVISWAAAQEVWYCASYAKTTMPRLPDSVEKQLPRLGDKDYKTTKYSF